MPNSAFMPVTDTGKAELLEHLVAVVPKYTDLLALSDADMQQLNKDAVGFRRALTKHHQVQSYAHNCTAQKNHLRDGGPGTANWPVAPAIDEVEPEVVTPGIIPRLSTLVASIKANKNYTTAIGQDLKLIGPEITTDPVTWQPVLASKTNAAHPVIVWTKGHASAIEIWVDRNDGNGFVFFAIKTTPDTVDKTPLPDKNAGVIWKYKAIYLLNDEQVGHWSDVMSIAVGV